MAQNSRNCYGFGVAGPLPAMSPTPIIAQRIPATTDINYEIGSLWINTVTNQAWHLTSTGGGIATYALASPGASDVDTINGLSPIAGNMIIDGGTNVTDVNGGNTVTLNLDAAITLATSVTSPLYTSAADLQITAPAGQDVIIQMGDAAGANVVSFTDSTTAQVFEINSNGTLTMAALTVVGALTQTAGIVSIGADAAANAVDIATGAAAKVVTVGSVTGASSLDLLAGTGNFTLEGNVATTYAISNTGVNTGQVDLAGGTGARTLNICGGGTGAKTINIGAAASPDVITVGSVTGAGSLDLLAGTGNFTLEGNVATTYAISNTGVNTGQVDLAGGTGVRTINLGGGGTGVKTINIGGAASADVITVGDATGAGSLDLVCGTGNMTLTSTGTGDISIDSDDTLLLDSDGVLELNSSAGIIGIGNDADAFGINIGTGAAQRDIVVGNGTGTTSLALDCGTGALNIGTNAIAHVVTIGNVTGASQVQINSGTNGVVVTTTGVGDVTIDSDDAVYIDADAAVEVNSSAGTLNIGNDADAFGINVGTGAAQRDIIIGNVTGTTSLSLLAGTGDITVTGTVLDLTVDFATLIGQRVTFTQSPIMQSAANTGAAPTGATGDVNIMSCQDGVMMETFALGAGQVIIAPRMAANGLLISGDLTATEGYEYNFGGARDNARHVFTIGTSAAFYMLCTFRIADISGMENFLMGFKRSGAVNNANFALYTDFATIGTSDAIAPGDAVIQTQLNTGGVITTDTNDPWNDNTNHEIGVYVDGAGVTTFTIDGIAPTATQAFTFDNGDLICPFFRHIFNAVAPGEFHIIDMEVGFQ